MTNQDIEEAIAALDADPSPLITFATMRYLTMAVGEMRKGNLPLDPDLAERAAIAALDAKHRQERKNP